MVKWYNEKFDTTYDIETFKNRIRELDDNCEIDYDSDEHEYNGVNVMDYIIAHDALIDTINDNTNNDDKFDYGNNINYMSVNKCFIDCSIIGSLNRLKLIGTIKFAKHSDHEGTLTIGDRIDIKNSIDLIDIKELRNNKSDETMPYNNIRSVYDASFFDFIDKVVSKNSGIDFC